MGTGSYTTPHFATDNETIDSVSGGSSGLHIHRGSASANRPYMIFAGMTGSTPGTKVGAVTVPINIDALTHVAYASLNTPTFTAFAGSLDQNGMAKASFNVPAGIATVLKGTDLTFAYVLVDFVDVTSRPVTVRMR